MRSEGPVTPSLRRAKGAACRSGPLVRAVDPQPYAEAARRRRPTQAKAPKPAARSGRPAGSGTGATSEKADRDETVGASGYRPDAAIAGVTCADQEIETGLQLDRVAGFRRSSACRGKGSTLERIGFRSCIPDIRTGQDDVRQAGEKTHGIEDRKGHRIRIANEGVVRRDHHGQKRKETLRGRIEVEDEAGHLARIEDRRTGKAARVGDHLGPVAGGLNRRAFHGHVTFLGDQFDPGGGGACGRERVIGAVMKDAQERRDEEPVRRLVVGDRNADRRRLGNCRPSDQKAGRGQ